MVIKNVKVFTESQRFEDGEIRIKNGVFTACGKGIGEENEKVSAHEKVLDGEGCYAIPGLIDIHFHGCKGYDFCDGTEDALREIARYEASVGVTAIAPATMTLPVEELERILLAAADYKRKQDACCLHTANNEERAHAIHDRAAYADLVGINMEGPFISRVKKGAQDEKYIIPCNVQIARRFLECSGGLVKFIGIAPEDNPDTVEFIQALKGEVNVSLAHTNADYDTAMIAFASGANHAVHLYNAMPTYTHRSPGVIGAVADSAHVNAEIICDGIHIHPAVVRATFKMLGSNRMILISDSMRATGMPDGQYTLGGQDVHVEGRRATLVSDGTIAGSATNLADCMRYAVLQMQIPLEEAVACATINPARSIGIDDMYGSIASGKKADVVLLNPDLSLKAVIKDGKRIR